MCVSAGFVCRGAQMSSQEWKVEEVTILWFIFRRHENDAKLR